MSCSASSQTASDESSSVQTAATAPGDEGTKLAASSTAPSLPIRAIALAGATPLRQERPRAVHAEAAPHLGFLEGRLAGEHHLDVEHEGLAGERVVRVHEDLAPDRLHDVQRAWLPFGAASD